MNDLSRDVGEPIEFKISASDDQSNGFADSSLEIDSSYSFLMVAAFLLIIATGLPTLSYILDKRDYSLANQRHLDSRTVKALNHLSNMMDLPFKYLLLKNAEISEILLGLRTSFSQVAADTQPILGILQKFSPE